MSETNLDFLQFDRIVEINGYKLLCNKNYCSKRRNVICESEKFKKYMEENNINYKQLILNNQKSINEFLHTFDDIKVIKIIGYY